MDNSESLTKPFNFHPESISSAHDDRTTLSLIDTQSVKNLPSLPVDETNATVTSSSMRKHLDYIYKRNLRTSRREDDTSSHIGTIETNALAASERVDETRIAPSPDLSI